MSRLPEINLSGTPVQIGEQHGEAMAYQIADAIDYYSTLLTKPLHALGESLQPVMKVLTDYPEIESQLRGIAAAANQDYVSIVALNARSELINNLNIGECTSLVDLQNGLYAQNWDWSKRIAPLMSVHSVAPINGPSYLTFTEPGIPTKLFINQEGLAAQLNILKCNQRLQSLPIHLVLHKLATFRQLGQADNWLMNDLQGGCASHVLLSDGKQAFSYEFDALSIARRNVTDGPFIHTNHYLDGLSPDQDFPTSYERYDYADTALKNGEMNIDVLTREDTNSPMRPYVQSEAPNFGEVGTVATISYGFDTPHLKIRTNDATPKWQTYSL